MTHTYAATPTPAQAPAHALSTAQAPTPTHNTTQDTAKAPTHAHKTAQEPFNRCYTCVTHKWSMPLDIRPSNMHALPLCAYVTPLRGAPTMSPPHAELINGYKKLGQHIIFPWFAVHTHTRTCGILQQAPTVSPANCQFC
ncbi:hypothetical protein O181_057762 [Austropuccinia psidii MF-1]|uniref:Uncharacterized protein n=1 Tax=Austropuccinia psidii MF-1 TaxID=1389203 RepID=A0A9Q3EDD2_9BASI|nr:hypothetical protein [Austropuccinia psidii MF-1]